jgi:endonuclease III
MQAYKKIYVTKKRAAIMLAANLETVDHLIYSCSFSDKKGGDIMLLALIFYMGIDSKGSKIVE